MMTVVAVTGDLMLQKPIVRDEAATLGAVSRMVHEADVAFANLEVALTKGDEAADKLVVLKADPALAAEVRRFGFEVVTIANNHATDYGVQGLRDTMQALKQADVQSVGAGDNLNEAFRPHVVERSGLRIAFLGIASTLPNGSAAGEARPGLGPVRVLSRFVVDPVSQDEQPGIAPFVETQIMPGDAERAAKAVRAAKASADIVIVGVHWGIPNGWVAAFQGPLAEYQQVLGHALIDAGADVVVGHHPHVLHGIERYQGKLIFYSLGNFLFHSLLAGNPDLRRPYPHYDWGSLRGEQNHFGALVLLELGKDEIGARLLPLWLDEAGEPRFADGGQADAVFGRITSLSEVFRTQYERREGRHGMEILVR